MSACPAIAGRPHHDIAEIVRRHRNELETVQALSVAQRRVLSAIEACRTSKLGGHVDVCCSCGYEHYHYHSCRNRHCPKCQALAQERWIAERCERLLPVKHFHVVFTLPSELRALGKYRPNHVLRALFTAASKTLLELGTTCLNARLGITMVLHTWTRDLRFHPHVHALVTAGGLAFDGSQWAASNSKYLFPVEVMGALLRGKMMDLLRTLHRDGAFDGFEDFRDPQGFEQLMARIARKDWVVYAKKPFSKAEHVLAYLGRYTHRVAISNSRLLDVREDTVTFRTKSGKTVTLSPVAFLRRFVQHVLPQRMHKIRHYGLYAGAAAHKGGKLEQARQQLPVQKPEPIRCAPTKWQDLLVLLTGRDVRPCPLCGATLQTRAIPRTHSREPP